MKDNLFSRIQSGKRVTPKDISLMADWDDVKRAIKYHYPDVKYPQNYEPVFERIQNATRRKPKKEDPLVISIGGFRDLKKDEWGCRDEFYNMSCEEYSMSFQPWNKLINTRINKDTLEHYTVEEILAHFIWKISWYGPEEEMKQKRKEIFSAGKECMKELNKKPRPAK